MHIKWDSTSNIGDTRGDSSNAYNFPEVLPFVIRSMRHRNLCDTPPRSCTVHNAIPYMPSTVFPASVFRVLALFATRVVRIHARGRLRNVNNGESSPEWSTRPMPRGTIVRLLGRGFFPAFQPGRGYSAIVLFPTRRCNFSGVNRTM